MNRTRLIERVGYACRLPTDSEGLDGQTITVVPTYPFNPDSPTAPKSAQEWSRCYGQNKPNLLFEFDNNPFSVRIIRLDRRASGGRAFKVLDDKARLFDLREDQLMEAISLAGIGQGGQLLAPVVWGQAGSHMKLAVVGGKLHERMVRGLEERKRRLGE